MNIRPKLKHVTLFSHINYCKGLSIISKFCILYFIRHLKVPYNMPNGTQVNIKGVTLSSDIRSKYEARVTHTLKN